MICSVRSRARTRTAALTTQLAPPGEVETTQNKAIVSVLQYLCLLEKAKNCQGKIILPVFVLFCLLFCFKNKKGGASFALSPRINKVSSSDVSRYEYLSVK
jgi:hypothetical protein